MSNGGKERLVSHLLWSDPVQQSLGARVFHDELDEVSIDHHMDGALDRGQFVGYRSRRCPALFVGTGGEMRKGVPRLIADVDFELQTNG